VNLGGRTKAEKPLADPHLNVRVLTPPSAVQRELPGQRVAITTTIEQRDVSERRACWLAGLFHASCASQR